VCAAEVMAVVTIS